MPAALWPAVVLSPETTLLPSYIEDGRDTIVTLPGMPLRPEMGRCSKVCRLGGCVGPSADRPMIAEPHSVEAGAGGWCAAFTAVGPKAPQSLSLGSTNSWSSPPTTRPTFSIFSGSAADPIATPGTLEMDEAPGALDMEIDIAPAPRVCWPKLPAPFCSVVMGVGMFMGTAGSSVKKFHTLALLHTLADPNSPPPNCERSRISWAGA